MYLHVTPLASQRMFTIAMFTQLSINHGYKEQLSATFLFIAFNFNMKLRHIMSLGFCFSLFYTSFLLLSLLEESLSF